ncbi:helix-turn-helix domain-containing protein [Sphingomonas sp. MMSM20]|uniref:helix-turn-helix domain-containing protein n=1 Tax=Sphingomonas lycopersici TaxID=2951807 RepID=UPI002238DDDC|nr:helix-turn-helix domain-containing protein [Sphingomonas lycopersici]
MARGIHDSRYRWVIEQLVEARKQQALTQQAVADKIGKPQQYVSRYETGERRLDIFEFIDVAAALDVDALSLIRTAPEAN